MITSKQVLESLADPTDKEIVITIMDSLFDWLLNGHSNNINQSIFSFYKRNVPDCIYSGKAYRVIWLPAIDALNVGLIKDRKHVDDLLKLTTNQVRYYLQKDKSYLSKVTSWAKTEKGIKSAIQAMNFRNLEYCAQILISDYVTGIDIMKVFNFLEIKLLKGKDNPYVENEKVLIGKYQRMLGVNSDTRKWAKSQEEIIAPFTPSTFQVVSIKWS
jgi:hypothetical protein